MSKLRRTQSFSQIPEEANEEEEGDDDHKNNKHNLSPEKQRVLKMKAIVQHERFSKAKGNVSMNANRAVAKTYFEQGSTRNSAHDEEFFHCFT